VDTPSSESAEELYEHAPCGFLSTLPNGTIVQVNQTFLTLTGYSREEVLAGRRFQDLLAVGGKIFHETHYMPLLQLQGFANEISFDLVCKDGKALPVLANTAQKKDAAGQVLLHRIAIFPISDRKNYERELRLARKKAEEAAKAKADFLSMMSHEIRTPMNAIIGLSNLLQQTGLSAQQQQYLQILQTSSENLLNLLNNILDFSKIEAGKVALEERPFNIRQLIYGIFHGLNVKAEEKGLRVQVEIDERVPAWLSGDPVKLGQVLTNLLGNAIKFTEHGSVTVALRVRELAAETVSVDFEVRDMGIGIAPDRLAHVFEEFTQASYDINQRYGGTGLGLTICQKLLGLYGSKLSVESTLGEGTTFSFGLRLKVAEGAEEATGPAEFLSDAQLLRGVRLLVAEDNSVNVFVLAQFLRRWGIDFDVVENGRQAIEKIQHHSYDLVLMDLQMPEMTGYEATRSVRYLPDERFRRLPILALTASSRIGLEEQADLAGFTDFVGKPFKPDELFAKLAQYASRPVALPTAPSSKVCWEQEQGKAELAVERASPAPRLSLEKFRALAEGDLQVLLELITLALQNTRKSKQDFQQVLEQGDLEGFEFQVHKMKMTLELLQACAVWSAIQQTRELLAQGGRDAARIRGAIHTLHQELDAVIEALEDEVRGLLKPPAGDGPADPRSPRALSPASAPPSPECASRGWPPPPPADAGVPSPQAVSLASSG
jgi:PAS domain S-box-containing protein